MRVYHVWFSTKGRKPALVESIDELVKSVFQEVATRTEIEVLEMETALDHVHMLVSLRNDQSLSIAMHDLKGAAARQVFLQFPELRLDMASNSFWQKGYGSRWVRSEEVEAVRKYILTQDQRPLRHRMP